jgi:hypothetical protein
MSSAPGGYAASSPSPDDIVESSSLRAAAGDVDGSGTQRLCGWCRRPLEHTAPPGTVYHNQKCRQAAFRLRRRRQTEQHNSRPLRMAFADPPYLGLPCADTEKAKAEFLRKVTREKKASKLGPRETDIVKAIRVALSTVPGLLLWRNNTGMLRDRNGTPVRYGLAVGSSDLIGILNGRFIALEVKRPGQNARSSQEYWMLQVRASGGFAAVVHSVDEARCAIVRARGGCSG